MASRCRSRRAAVVLPRPQSLAPPRPPSPLHRLDLPFLFRTHTKQGVAAVACSDSAGGGTIWATGTQGPQDQIEGWKDVRCEHTSFALWCGAQVRHCQEGGCGRGQAVLLPWQSHCPHSLVCLPGAHRGGFTRCQHALCFRPPLASAGNTAPQRAKTPRNQKHITPHTATGQKTSQRRPSLLLLFPAALSPVALVFLATLQGTRVVWCVWNVRCCSRLALFAAGSMPGNPCRVPYSWCGAGRSCCC